MTNFAGVMTSTLYGQLAGRSADIDAMSAPAADAHIVSVPMSTSARAGSGLVGVIATGAPSIATLAPTYANELRNKVIVIPGTKAMGFVFSDTTFSVELWNTSDTARMLTATSVSGPDGVTLSNSYTLPKSMPVSASYTYAVTVEAAGGPTISNTVTWTFTGLSGTDLVITGLRLVPFSLSPDWTDGIVEHTEYYTDILTAYDGTEQRVQLLGSPRRGFDFTAMTEGAKDVALLGALLYGWQSKIYGMPVWPEMSRATAQVTAGDVVIHVDTTYMDLSSGFVILWRDMHTWEAFAIDSHTSSTITVQSPAARTWPIYTHVMPVLNVRLDLQQDVEYLTPEIATIGVRFTAEIA